MGNFWYIWLLPLVSGMIWLLSSGALIWLPSAILRRKFSKLRRKGGAEGKSYGEIVAVCGTPNLRSRAPGGMLCQWFTTGYHVALIFDENDICIGSGGESEDCGA